MPDHTRPSNSTNVGLPTRRREFSGVLKRGRRGWTMALGLMVVFAAGIGLGVGVAPGRGGGQGQGGGKRLLDNERGETYAFVFPPGVQGDEHEAPRDEV